MKIAQVKWQILAGFLVLLAVTAAVWYDTSTAPQTTAITPGLEKSGKNIYSMQLSPTPLPPVNLPNLKGDIVALDKLTEPVLLINFWATWCTPCVEEFPQLIELVNHMQGELALVTISADRFPAEAQKWQQQMVEKLGDKALNPHIYWLWDKNREVAFKQFNVLRLPESVLVNQSRQMTHKVVGVIDWTSPETRAF